MSSEVPYPKMDTDVLIADLEKDQQQEELYRRAMDGDIEAIERFEGDPIRFNKKSSLHRFMIAFVGSKINLYLYETITSFHTEAVLKEWNRVGTSGGTKDNGEITIGFFPDTQEGIDDELITFFHELGHLYYGADEEALTKYEVESRVWKKCFLLMEKYHLQVTDQMREMANNYLKTYDTPERRAPTCLPFAMKAAEITETSRWICPYCKEPLNFEESQIVRQWFDQHRYNQGEILLTTSYCKNCHKPYTLFAEIGRA